MKYAEKGFRPLYKNFCIYPLNPIIKEALKDQKGIEEAEGVMVYGYVDHQAGNTVELIALTKKNDDKSYSFIRLEDSARFFIRIESIMREEFEFVDFGNGHLAEQFKRKLVKLIKYDQNDYLIKSRCMIFLDEFRHEKNFDDVKVILYKEGLEIEGVWVRVEALDKGVIMGTLLNDPAQDFGVKTGSPISFVVNEGKDKKRTLVADLTPRKTYKAKELEDGKLLKDAIVAFNDEKNKFKMFTVLEILRDSTVFVPYNKNGVEILSAKNKKYFPAFSNSIEMWELDEDIIKKPMPFMEVIAKAKTKSNIEGIVVNAFSESFFVPVSMFEVIEGLESKLEE